MALLLTSLLVSFWALSMAVCASLCLSIASPPVSSATASLMPCGALFGVLPFRLAPFVALAPLSLGALLTVIEQWCPAMSLFIRTLLLAMFITAPCRRAPILGFALFAVPALVSIAPPSCARALLPLSLSL